VCSCGWTRCGNDYQATRLELEALVNRVGLTPPATVAGWRDVLDLLNGVATTIEAFGEGIFSQDLDMLCFATGNRSWRRQHAGSGGFWQRRTAIKQFRQSLRNGPRNRAALHLALTAGAQQRDRWRNCPPGPQDPPLPQGLSVPSATTSSSETTWRPSRRARAFLTWTSIPHARSRQRSAAERRPDTLHQIPDINQLSDRLSGVA